MSIENKTEAVKFDGGKLPIHLIPTSAILAISEVLAYGAEKYGEWNWSKGMDWSRLVGAALRHLLAWKDGEDKDSETGLSHLAHVGCCIIFLLAYEKHGIDNDDRHKFRGFELEYDSSPPSAEDESLWIASQREVEVSNNPTETVKNIKKHTDDLSEQESVEILEKHLYNSVILESGKE